MRIYFINIWTENKIGGEQTKTFLGVLSLFLSIIICYKGMAIYSIATTVMQQGVAM